MILKIEISIVHLQLWSDYCEVEIERLHITDMNFMLQLPYSPSAD